MHAARRGLKDVSRQIIRPHCKGPLMWYLLFRSLKLRFIWMFTLEYTISWKVKSFGVKNFGLTPLIYLCCLYLSLPGNFTSYVKWKIQTLVISPISCYYIAFNSKYIQSLTHFRKRKTWYKYFITKFIWDIMKLVQVTFCLWSYEKLLKVVTISFQAFVSMQTSAWATLVTETLHTRCQFLP